LEGEGWGREELVVSTLKAICLNPLNLRNLWFPFFCRGRRQNLNPMITLLTDFGLDDAYVGAMKGVIASLAPGVPIFDICHTIEPRNVRRGGLVWRASAPYFPHGTIHVGVVDPGVGSRRKILAVAARGSIFLCPDNGLISYSLERRDIKKVRQLKRRELCLEKISDTFHGRDIFAPVAARLATGLSLDEVGPAVRSYRWEGLPKASRRRKGRVIELRGQIVDFDRFGNGMTNLEPPPGSCRRLEFGSQVVRKLSQSYAQAGSGRTLAIVGSAGLVEIAVSGGNARRQLGLALGDVVVGRWEER